MNNGRLLWVDDEIELLKAHILFLENKGYELITVSNGTDAIEQCRVQTFDLILLDEMMPGLSGLETLQKIKEIQDWMNNYPRRMFGGKSANQVHLEHRVMEQ